MSLRVLIAPDKFKGTLTAREAAEAIADGWSRGRPRDRARLVPMSDGGDGFGEVLSGLLNARARQLSTLDAAHRTCTCQWWWEPQTRTAIVESARIVGLAMLPPGRYHPFELDTAGLGRVLETSARCGCRSLVVGVGGSATNDGGFGMARALGWRFVDRGGGQIRQWTALRTLERLEPPDAQPFRGVRVTVAVDVQNRLLGARGCARIYGPQKGLRPQDIPVAEANLRRLALVAKRQFGTDYSRVPGAGAAGGLGFGLMVFAGAQVESGTDLFARRARLRAHLLRSDLVITGEGSMDRSSLMGKGVGEIARRCASSGLPCLGLAGVVADRRVLLRRFTQVRALCELTSPQDALRRPGLWLRRLARLAAEAWSGRVP